MSTIETKPIVKSTTEEIKPSKTISDETTVESPANVISSVVQVVSEPTPATKKPKKKKNKTTPIAIDPQTVKAVTAITPEPPKVIISSKVEVIASSGEGKFIVEPVKVAQQPVSSIVEVLDDDDAEISLQDGNSIAEPEYDFLSRQPTEFVEETYRVVNLKPSGIKKPKTAVKTSVKENPIHPTGLVTKSGGTVVKDGVTTVHETSVIGTYINGKYAQVLQSTSQIFHGQQKPKIQPSSTLRILKTAAPSLNKTPKYISNEDEFSVESVQSGPNLVRTSRRPAQAALSFKNRLKNRDEVVAEEIVTPSQPINSFSGGKKSSSSRRSGLGKNKRYVNEQN